MTYNPPTLVALGTYWTAQGGVNLGVVGNTAHTKGYHLGKDRIYDGSGPGLGDNDYSVKTARDKAGLTNAASAIDLGKLDGSLKGLRMFSTWLVAQARANKPGTSDLREIIYSPDGATVLRWDRQRGYNSVPRPGEADDSHLTHTHISWYRDAQARDHTTAFRPYFEEPAGDDMPNLSTYTPGHVAVVKATSNIRSAPAVTGTLIRNITSPETWTVVGYAKGGTDTDGACTTDQWLTRWFGGRWEYTSKCNVTSGPTAPAGDCTAQVKAATDPLNATIATQAQTIALLEQSAATAHLDGKRAEWDRQAAGATVAVKLLDRP